GGYAGRWEIIEARREVLHHVETAFVPNRIGRTIRRSYSFEDTPGSLVLSLRPVALEPGEAAPNRVLRWRRRA
ncbi:MAG: lipocalin-like domain-containing protein, partial [Acidobacteriota bacterium]